MDYKIIHSTPGRLRVRFGSFVFTKGQGYALAAQLSSYSEILEVQTAAINGSILLHYQEDKEQKIHELLQDIDMSLLPEQAPNDTEVMKEADDRFINRLLGKIGMRYFCKWLLPPQVNQVVILCQAAVYIGRGIKSLLNYRMDVELLDASAISASLLQRDYATASSVMFLLSISSLLEEYTHARAKLALGQSLRIHVDSVWRINRGKEELVPLSEIQLKDRIIVRSGSMIPVDGKVQSGEAMINESALTGEPLSVMRRKGASVYAGTVVQEGSLTIQVRALADQTRIQKIVDFIDQSEDLKASVQGEAERLADRIVPYSFWGAFAVFLATGNWRKAASVLMVDYSCAIKLATPIAVISALKEAANNKIMVKGGKFLEFCMQADTVVFDKTGTLTLAKPHVSKIIPFGRYSRREVLRLAACIEEHFPHSIARAIVRQAAEENLIHEEEHAEVEYVVAHGISTMYQGKRALIGSEHFIVEDEKVPVTTKQRQILDEETVGMSYLLLSVNHRLVGCICVDDPPRPEVKEVLVRLHELGIQKIIMLTGDNQHSAQRVAVELGMDDYRAQVLPEQKASIVQELKEQGHVVLMVGDGINDSPALTVANVSVAMREGSDIAREVADVTLLSDDLWGLVYLREMSQFLFKRIHQNYSFILGFNTLLLAGGLFGILTPATMAFLHNSSTMCICAHSTRPLLLEKQVS